VLPAFPKATPDGARPPPPPTDPLGGSRCSGRGPPSLPEVLSGVTPEQQRYLVDAIALAEQMVADPSAFARGTLRFTDLMVQVRWGRGSLPAPLARRLYDAAARVGHSSVQGAALESLGRADPAYALPLARQVMDAACDRSLRDAASAAWLVAQGLDSPFEAIGCIPDRELHEWPLPAQHIYVLCDLINQVCSNGFSGWCGNGYASRWRLTLDACHAVGAKQTAELVQEAVDAFGPFDGMTESQIEDRLHGPQYEVVRAAADRPNGEFWSDGESLRCRMAVYMVKHYKLFAALRRI